MGASVYYYLEIIRATAWLVLFVWLFFIRRYIHLNSFWVLFAACLSVLWAQYNELEKNNFDLSFKSWGWYVFHFLILLFIYIDLSRNIKRTKELEKNIIKYEKNNPDYNDSWRSHTNSTEGVYQSPEENK